MQALQPRGYQRDLAELAFARNLIVMLPTGSGKTLIAVLLVSRYAGQVASAVGTSRPLFIVFTAPTRTLVKQQAAVLRETTPLRVRELTAESGLDFWDAATWRSELSTTDVLVCPPAVLRDALDKAYLRLSDVVLLILDECHNAAKNDPGAVLLREHFAHLSPQQRPRVLGLTASPHNGRAKAYEAAITGLERLLDARLVTAVDAEEVARHAPRATASVLRHPPCPVFGGGGDVPSSIKALRSLRLALPELGLFCAACAMRHALRVQHAWAAGGARPGGGSEGGGGGGGGGFVAALPQPLAAHKRKGAGGGAPAADDAVADELLSAARAVLGASFGAGGLRSRDGGGAPPGAHASAYDARFSRAAAAAEAVLAASPPGACLLTGAGVAAGWVSPKAVALLTELASSIAAGGPGWRGVVFAERRITAFALAALINAALGGDENCSASSGRKTAGCQYGHEAGDAAATRAQAADLAAFRNGSLPLLVSTSVLEEGVDVPRCALVVLFDLKRNVRAFIQSRGRARDPVASRLLLLARGGSPEADDLLRSVAAAEAGMGAAAAARAAAIAAGDEGGFYDEIGSAAGGGGGGWAAAAAGPQFYGVPSTGARVSLVGAVSLLHVYCSKLPHDGYAEAAWWRPLFTVETTNAATNGATLHACAVVLPGHAWFAAAGAVSSGAQPSAKAARAACALAAIAKLHAHGELTDRLVPACVALDEEGSGSDDVSDDEGCGGGDGGGGAAGARAAPWYTAPQLFLTAKTPDALLPLPPKSTDCSADGSAGASAAVPASLAGAWHASTLASVAGGAGGAAVAPARLAFLTRAPLAPRPAALPPLRLLRGGRSADARLVPCAFAASGRDDAVTIVAGSGEEASLRAFTAWVQHHFFEDAFPGAGRLTVVAAPLRRDIGDADAIDWPLLADPRAAWNVPAACPSPPQPPPPVGWVVACPTREGLPKSYYVLRSAPASSVDVAAPLDNDPSLPPLRPTLAQVWSARGLGSGELRTCEWLVVANAPSRPRTLAPGPGWAPPLDGEPPPPPPPPQELLLPAPLVSHVRVPSPLHAALMELPSVLRALSALLLAAELATKLRMLSFCGGGAAGDDDAAVVDALRDATTTGAAGEARDYQLLEVVGDAWLKHAASCFVFCAHPLAHEGALTSLRKALVSNAALIKVAAAAGLQRFVRAAPFLRPPRDAPPLHPKCLADVAEAVVGAAVTARGETEAWRVAHSLGMLPSPRPPLDAYIAAVALLRGGADMDGGDGDDDGGGGGCDALLAPLEAAVRYALVGTAVPAVGRTGRTALLREALSHGSSSACALRGKPAYQRLEFLGDAALDWLAVRHALASSIAPARLTQGWVTAFKAAALNNERLGERAAALRLPSHLRHGSAALHADMLGWAAARGALAPRDGDGSSGGCDDGACPFGGDGPAAPKVMADILEAVCGAILLDSRLELSSLAGLAEHLGLSASPPTAAGQCVRVTPHPVTALFEACQRLGVPPIGHAEPLASQPPGAVTFTWRVAGVDVGRGEGASRAAARKAGAAAALRAWASVEPRVVAAMARAAAGAPVTGVVAGAPS